MKEYKSFKEFYPFYLTQHQNLTCRRLHCIGTSLVFLCLLVSLITWNAFWLLLIPILGYGFAWIGHFVYEKNKPATFKYPMYSLLADFVLFKEMMLHRKKQK